MRSDCGDLCSLERCISARLSRVVDRVVKAPIVVSESERALILLHGTLWRTPSGSYGTTTSNRATADPFETDSVDRRDSCFEFRIDDTTGPRTPEGT